MLLRQESLPQANIYSSKILFDQMEDRNKKRMNQILRRKKALSTKNKTVKYDEEKSNISPKREKEESNVNILNQFNQSIYNINFINEDYPKNKVELKNSINDINNNNSTNHNSSILNRYSQEREVSASNIEEDTTELLISNQNLTQNINNTSSTPKIYQDNKSIINIDIINCDEPFNDEIKENSNYFDSNEFAIKYLSSSLDSFIKLDNHLVAKAKFQNNCFTDSYSQALELNCNDNTNNYKTFYSRNYLVTEIIKEEREKEGETPLKRKNKKEKEKEKEKYINNNLNDEEKEIMKRMERRRAYSKRIRNNVLNKNFKEELGINLNITKKNSEKIINKSKSCKKLIGNNTKSKGCKNICIIKRNDIKKHSFYIKRKKNQEEINNNYLNKVGRKTIYNFKNKLSLNNSFNHFNKNDKNIKTITGMNSSKNIKIKNNNKNEKLHKGVCISRSNLNIFKNNAVMKNKNNLNISMNNFYPKLIRKDKIRKSKSAKKINDYSKNDTLNNTNNINDNSKYAINEKLSIKLKKINTINTNANNNNKTLKKNPTMGRLTFLKKTNINKKDDNSKNENLNKTVMITSNRKDCSILSNAISYKNIKYKRKNNNNCTNINTRNSMPLKIKTKKIVKNILNTGNKAVNKLKLNKSFCYLTNKDKDKNS